ncbi:phage shock protein operon transcriptional activator [Sphingomonas sp. LY29]|uniref:phage shock protein operon transcriptional activator n=1 Tax=unclassified Sphingomonas TaxID=196159 RepID=UPI002ADEEF67|nr:MULTISPECIES: phage shock protein operon transcriptional activator [unclassified Sphingomonas]MEA1071271.1 phage shock protein operon transcriptional activator [Sphingomonas sp. LY160]WRP26023.1 phage shock protein operon transcriptional activator [Sphingomonas sp. LY29]
MERTTQFVGQSLAFLDAVERASRAAPLNRPVLVIGERGTGKELIAERLHHLSQRWAGPLVTMNCAALPENLIEAELFGHEAGSFTGAAKTRHGRFEEADGGTLFLDELATLSSPAQDRLLRAVEYGEVTRIGASKPIQVDVRIVAATNEHLPRLVEEGRFRADLLDRLSFEVVTLPPLRVRKGDIVLLAEHFGRRMAVELEWSNWPGFSAQAQDAMENYRWPGNVRELRNAVERAVYRHENPEREIEQLQFDPFSSPWALTEAPEAGGSQAPVSTPSPSAAAVSEEGPPVPASGTTTTDDFRAAVSNYEKALLEDALSRNRFNQRATAAALGLSYDQLRHALKRHKLLDAGGA